jgi:hypothetical protein
MNPRVSGHLFRSASGPPTIVIDSQPVRRQGASPNQPAKFISSRFPRTPVAITAPVSHQKRSQRDATNTIKLVKS